MPEEATQVDIPEETEKAAGGDLGERLELAQMKLQRARDPDSGVSDEKLVKMGREVRNLRKQMRIKRVEKELKELKSGENDEMDMGMGLY